MMNLKLFPVIIVLFIAAFNGINKFSKPQTYQEAKNNINVAQQTPEAFFKTQCGFCHNKEQLIAPDMNKIKAVYLKKYPTKEAFIKAITAFVKNPDKKNAIYKEGIEKFTDMPKMPFKDAQIKNVAEYIFSTSGL